MRTVISISYLRFSEPSSSTFDFILIPLHPRIVLLFNWQSPLAPLRRFAFWREDEQDAMKIKKILEMRIGRARVCSRSRFIYERGPEFKCVAICKFNKVYTLKQNKYKSRQRTLLLMKPRVRKKHVNGFLGVRKGMYRFLLRLFQNHPIVPTLRLKRFDACPV